MSDLNEIRDKIKEGLAETDGKAVLLNAPPESCLDAALLPADLMIRKGRKGIYVTISRPYIFISDEMKKRHIDEDNIAFIDCISATAGEHSYGNCIYVDNPSSLEEIGMDIALSINKMGDDEKFLIIDSIPTLLIYNDLFELKKFLTVLIQNLKASKVCTIFVNIDGELPVDFRQKLNELCDQTILL